VKVRIFMTEVKHWRHGVLFSQRFPDVFAAPLKVKCQQFLSNFDQHFPAVTPSKLDPRCRIVNEFIPDYLDAGPENIPAHELFDLPPSRARTFRDLSDDASAKVILELKGDRATRFYNYFWGDASASHFHRLVKAKYYPWIDDGTMQYDFYLISLSIALGFSDGQFIEMLTSCYLCGYLPCGWHGEYPDNYGLLVFPHT
jgi:hypothetical protein